MKKRVGIVGATGMVGRFSKKRRTKICGCSGCPLEDDHSHP